jgi:dihydrofolate synthase/folylpolyglutamate synthase
MMPAIERTAAQFGRPTYYETLLALAFVYFADERVDVAVIEVGLGGRLDGTNLVLPMVAAITSVGYDHTDVLGSTIEAIAFEKAGIAKPGVPLVLAVVPATALAVIERYAAEVGAPLVYVSEAARRAAAELRLRTLGGFQRANAATAIAVLERIDDDLRPTRAETARALEELDIPGRMERFSAHPDVVFDVAHNVEKAEALVAALRESFPGRRIHYVVAIGESKDARRILEVLAELPSTFTFTSFAASGRRAIRPQRLATIAESFRSWGRAISDPIEALTVARRTATVDDVVVVTGSTFLVADVRQWFVPSAVH